MTRRTYVAPAGFDSHNVYVNPDKTKLSFALQLVAALGASGSQPAAGPRGGGEVMPATLWRAGERHCRSCNPNCLPGVFPAHCVSNICMVRPTGDGSTFVKWCGLLINTDSLELQGDYTRCGAAHVAAQLEANRRAADSYATDRLIPPACRPACLPAGTAASTSAPPSPCRCASSQARRCGRPPLGTGGAEGARKGIPTSMRHPAHHPSTCRPTEPSRHLLCSCPYGCASTCAPRSTRCCWTQPSTPHRPCVSTSSR